MEVGYLNIEQQKKKTHNHMKGDTDYLNIKKLNLSINILQQWG